MHAKQTYEEWSEERRQEGRQEGRKEGMLEGIQYGRLAAAGRALLRFWPRLYGEVPDTLDAAIRACKDADALEASMNILASAESADDAARRILLLNKIQVAQDTL